MEIHFNFTFNQIGKLSNKIEKTCQTKLKLFDLTRALTSRNAYSSREMWLKVVRRFHNRND